MISVLWCVHIPKLEGGSVYREIPSQVMETRGNEYRVKPFDQKLSAWVSRRVVKPLEPVLKVVTPELLPKPVIKPLRKRQGKAKK
jgi:hypothetical protein